MTADTRILPPAVVAFIGLGTMGAPMARRLATAGYRLSVYDTSPAAMERLADAGCRAASSPADAAAGAAVVITMLPSSPHVRLAMTGPDGAAAALQPGALFVDMSTVDDAESRKLATELEAQGIRVLDAPVGRSPRHAAEGTLLVMAGGRAEDVEAARPLFDQMAEAVHHLGPQGSGIALKLINNYMSMVGMVLAAEGLTLARKAGLDRGQVVEVLSGTPAGRGQLTTNFPRKVLAGDITPDFPLSMGLKDITLALALGAERASPLHLGAAARQLYALAGAWGREGQDCTAMLLLMEDIAQAAVIAEEERQPA